MTEERPPQDPPDAENADDIIELTDVVSSPETAEEDIIELTDVVEEAGAADEDVIELTDVVEEAGTGDEDIIELTDVVTPSPEEAPPPETPQEEPLIELTDVVASSEAAETAGEDEIPDLPMADGGVDAEEPVDTEPLEDRFEPAEDEKIMMEAAVEGVEESTSGDLEFADMELDIEGRKEEGLFDSLGMNMEADLLETDEETGELDFNLSTQELSDAIDLLDAKLAEEPPSAPPADEVRPAASEDLEPDQLEAALERVIRKMFAEKIDSLLDDAIQKTVSAEIARLKDQLLGDTPDKP